MQKPEAEVVELAARRHSRMAKEDAALYAKGEFYSKSVKTKAYKARGFHDALVHVRKEFPDEKPEEIAWYGAVVDLLERRYIREYGLVDLALLLKYVQFGRHPMPTGDPGDYLVGSVPFRQARKDLAPEVRRLFKQRMKEADVTKDMADHIYLPQFEPIPEETWAAIAPIQPLIRKVGLGDAPIIPYWKGGEVMIALNFSAPVKTFFQKFKKLGAEMKGGYLADLASRMPDRFLFPVPREGVKIPTRRGRSSRSYPRR